MQGAVYTVFAASFYGSPISTMVGYVNFRTGL